MSERFRSVTLGNGVEEGVYGDGSAESPLNFAPGANVYDIGEIVWKASKEDLMSINGVFVDINGYKFCIKRGRSRQNVLSVSFEGTRKHRRSFSRPDVDLIVVYATAIQAGLAESMRP